MDNIEAGSPSEGGGNTPEDALSALNEAESSGKLKPLADLMVEMGWDEDPGSLVLLAQKDDRTAGKSPDELATMMRDDPSLYDDLVAYKPGGALEGLAKGTKKGESGESGKGESEGPETEVEINVGGEGAEGEEPSDEEVGGFLGASTSMKGADIGKAKGAMKAAGFKPGRDDMDLEKKRKMMEKMGE